MNYFPTFRSCIILNHTLLSIYIMNGCYMRHVFLCRFIPYVNTYYFRIILFVREICFFILFILLSKKQYNNLIYKTSGLESDAFLSYNSMHLITFYTTLHYKYRKFCLLTQIFTVFYELDAKDFERSKSEINSFLYLTQIGH